MRSTVVARQVPAKPTDNPFRRPTRAPLETRSRIVVALLSLAVSLLAGCAQKTANRCKAISSEVDRLQANGDPRAALQKAREGLDVCRGPQNQTAWWNFYLSRAELLNALDSYDEATAALQQDPPSGSKYAYVRTSRRIEQSWAAGRKGDFAHAESLLNDAETEAAGTGKLSARFLSSITVRKVILFRDEGKVDEAREAFERINPDDGSMDRAHYLAIHGWILQNSGRFEDAAQTYEEALPGLQSSGTPVEIGQFLNNLGAIYYHLGDLSRALSYLSKAEPALKHAGDRAGLRVCYNTEGVIYLDSGNYPKASEYLHLALDLAVALGEPSGQAEAANNLALNAIAAKDWKQAESYNQRAMLLKEKLHNREATLYSLLNRARIFEKQDEFSPALDTLERMCAQPYINPSLRLDAEEEYLILFRRLHEESSARAHYLTALSLSDQVRASLKKDDDKLAWFSSRNTLNQEWVRFLIEMKHPDEALEAAESSRARLMLERMGRKSGAAASHVAQYRQVAQAQDAVLVSYWLAPDVSYAWVVKPGHTDLVQLPGEQQITPYIASYRGFVEEINDPLHTDNTSGRHLREAILDPVLPYLNGAKRVILVPDGSLHELNFETLVVNGHYWIDDVALTVTPSLNLLTRGSPARRDPHPTLFAIGDAVPTPQFPKLAHAGPEIDAVAALFPNAAILRGAQATPAAYLQESAAHTYIHFAAHASASSELPLESAVILSPVGSDGRLTARALLDKPIRAELVTISACRSAGGRSYHGEGLVGFAWVFLQTGAHGVIAGLWDASDEAAARIMSGLYTRIARGETPPDALRQAKLELAHSQGHFNRPYYWAPFQYYLGASR